MLLKLFSPRVLAALLGTGLIAQRLKAGAIRLDLNDAKMA
jgi:hypothetical protein